MTSTDGNISGRLGSQAFMWIENLIPLGRSHVSWLKLGGWLSHLRCMGEGGPCMRGRHEDGDAGNGLDLSGCRDEAWIVQRSGGSWLRNGRVWIRSNSIPRVVPHAFFPGLFFFDKHICALRQNNHEPRKNDATGVPRAGLVTTRPLGLGHDQRWVGGQSSEALMQRLRRDYFARAEVFKALAPLCSRPSRLLGRASSAIAAGLHIDSRVWCQLAPNKKKTT